MQNFAWAVKTDPEHPLRKAIDTFLVEFAIDLQNDPDTIERAERIKHQVVAHPDVQKFIGQAWGTVKKLILDAAADPSSALRMRVRDGLRRLRQAADRPTPSCAARSTAGSPTPPATSCGTTAARSPR